MDGWWLCSAVANIGKDKFVSEYNLEGIGHRDQLPELTDGLIVDDGHVQCILGRFVARQCCSAPLADDDTLLPVVVVALDGDEYVTCPIKV